MRGAGTRSRKVGSGREQDRAGLIGQRLAPAAGMDRLTILPPPPSVPLPDPRAPRLLLPWVPDLSQGDQGEIELGIEDLREPTDVDGTRWWDNEDDEDAVITERPPRFQQTH